MNLYKNTSPCDMQWYTEMVNAIGEKAIVNVQVRGVEKKLRDIAGLSLELKCTSIDSTSDAMASLKRV